MKNKKNILLAVSSIVLIVFSLFEIIYITYYAIRDGFGFSGFIAPTGGYAESLLAQILLQAIMITPFVYLIIGILGLVFKGKEKTTMIPIISSIVGVIYVIYQLLFNFLLFKPSENIEVTDLITLVALLRNVAFIVAPIFYFIGAMKNRRFFKK